MPSIRPKGAEAEPRSTFRPPWVKDGPPPLPAPPPSWMGNRPPPQQQENTQKVQNVVQPKLRDIRSDSLKDSKEKTIPIRKEKENIIGESGISQKTREGNAQMPSKTAIKKGEQSKPDSESGGRSKARVLEKKVSVQIPDDKLRKVSKEFPPSFSSKQDVTQVQEQAPLAPKNMANAPPPPPLPPPRPPPLPEKQSQNMTEGKKQKLEALRSRPRRRPDWTDMMKEVEEGIKLNHVKCNDRSAPVIPKTKARGQFVYESEKRNAHNLLLKEIQSGVSLKKVKTNDRSKPILDGLRKFRRQMTIEEQIQKSASVADVIAVAAEPDELDDIDKVRDDLQSTKQMLALEMRNKEAVERENKRLMARLLNLEAELEKEKLTRKLQGEGSQTVPVRTAEDENLIAQLKEEASQSASMAKEMEDQYHKTAEELDLTRAKLESSWLRNSQLEMELKSKGKNELIKQRSMKKMSLVSQGTVDLPNKDYSDESESDTEEDIDEDDGEPVTSLSHEERQYNVLSIKVRNLKEKRVNAAREKKNLKAQLNKLQTILKEEKKRYHMLQSEVEKMANIMKDVEEGGELDDDQHTEDEEVEDEEVDEQETETDSSTEAESEGEPGADVNLEGKCKFLERKVKEYETLLSREKKANYLLKANIDRRQDDLNRQKELSLVLQEDLNAVLTELG